MRKKKIRRDLESSVRDGIASDLFACKEAFDQAQVSWVIIDGIVLGYARERNILSWDTDLDVGIFCGISPEKWQELYVAFRNAGFNVKNRKQDFVFGRRSVKLNLWIYHKKGKFYEAFPYTTPGIKFVEKTEWFDEPQLVKFLGDRYPMPDHLEDYLIYHYGTDWQLEKPNHEDWRKEKFGVSSGRFKPAAWLASRCGPEGDLWPRIMKIND